MFENEAANLIRNLDLVSTNADVIILSPTDHTDEITSIIDEMDLKNSITVKASEEMAPLTLGRKVDWRR